MLENKTKVRIDKFDNLRGLAILLVLLCHFNFTQAIPLEITRYLYFIHLPLFFFVAGYFSKIDSAQPLKSFKRLIVPYLIFCVLIELFRYAVSGSLSWKMIFIHPSMALWFLIALFIMKMILPIFDKFKFPIMTSIVIALVFGMYNIDPNLLGLTRAVGYMPVFLVGFYYNSYKNKLKTDYPKIFNFTDNRFYLIALLIIIISIAVTLHKPPFDIFFKIHYAQGNMIKDCIKRFIVIFCKIGMALVLNRIMTNNNCFLTKFGRNSMAIYVLHPFVYYFFKPIWSGIFTNSIISVVATVALTLIVTIVLSRDIVTKYLNKFTDGAYTLIVNPSK